MSGLAACEKTPARQFAEAKSQTIIGGENISTNSKFTSRVIYLALGVEKKTTPSGFTIGQKAICTASALTSRILITAAHCVKDWQAENINAVLTLNPWNHPLNLDEWVQVEKIKIHESYVNKENQIENDLALLRLSSELTPDRISQLADSGQVGPENLSVISIGYGQTSALKNMTDEKELGGSSSIQKQNSLLNYVMKNVEKFDPLSPVFQIDQSDFKGLCHGDSGGPGYIYDESKQDFYILGVTSFVSIFESEKLQKDPNNIYNTCIGRGNYTNLLHYKEWITQSLVELK